jgi:hypothetical protein
LRLRQGPDEEVGDRLDHPEGEDERQRAGERGQSEDAVGQQRDDRAFLAEGAADQRVDRDQEAELGEIGP